jgi:hypothetical protein
MAAPAPLVGLDEHAGRIRGNPMRVVERVLAHGGDHVPVSTVARDADQAVEVTSGTGPASGEGLGLHLFAAAHPLDVTRHYYELSGYPGLPARWALGPLVWRDENDDQARVESDADTLRYEIARRALGGPDEAGRSSYQVAVSRWQDCGQASIEAAGESHPVEEAVVTMATCDGQLLGSVAGGGPSPPRSESPRPHVGASGPAPTGKRHARQSIPPAVRREVRRRHAGRCAVPGCAHHRFRDVHHLDPRAEGGSDDPERLAPLCGAHHRAVHLGRLCIDGRASAGFRFRHAGRHALRRAAPARGR